MEINIQCSPGLQAEITEKSIHTPRVAVINSIDVYVYRACGTSGNNALDSGSERGSDCCAVGHFDADVHS